MSINKKNPYAPESIGKTEPAGGFAGQGGRQGRGQTEVLNSWDGPNGVELVGHTVPANNGFINGDLPMGPDTTIGTMPLVDPVIPIDPIGHTEPATFGSRMVDIGVTGPMESFRPVMGWLVCIKGPDCGRSFQIYSEYNYVGRERGDIIIPGDQSISGANHMRISYEPRQRVFSVSLCEGHNHVYLNGMGLEGFARLKDYDIIETGKTFLLFKSLCSDQFSWDQVDSIIEKL